MSEEGLKIMERYIWIHSSYFTPLEVCVVKLVIKFVCFKIFLVERRNGATHILTFMFP